MKNKYCDTINITLKSINNEDYTYSLQTISDDKRYNGTFTIIITKETKNKGDFYKATIIEDENLDSDIIFYNIGYIRRVLDQMTDTNKNKMTIRVYKHYNYKR